MKYFLLAICCLFLINDSYGQRKRKKSTKSPKYLTVQGGFLFDTPDKDLNDRFGHTEFSPNNYLGFNLLNIRLQRLKNEKLTSLGLKVVGFKKEGKRELLTDAGGNTFYLPHYDREKLAFEFRVNHSIPLFGNIENGLYVGPAFSLGFTRDYYIANNPNNIPRSLEYISFAGGFNLDYYLKLSKKIFLTIGTQGNLLDFATGRQRIENPIITINQQSRGYTKVRFLPPPYPLMLGLTFALGK